MTVNRKTIVQKQNAPAAPWRRILALASAAALATWGAAAPAQEYPNGYPNRSIRVITPYPAGGPVDALARALGAKFQERTGQPFIIEAHPGANTNIAGQKCVDAMPDGYTICLLTSTTLSVNSHLYKDSRFKPFSLAPISNVASSRSVFMLHKNVPAKNLHELVEWSKTNPGKINYASFGVGGETHLMVEWLKKKTGLQMTHVPFTGFAPAVIAFDSGEVQVLIPVATPMILDRIAGGQAKAIFIMGDQRLGTLPAVQSLPELGLPPINFEVWFGMLAPAGVPASITEKLSAEIRSIVADKEFTAKFITASGLTATTNTPEEFKAFLTRDDKAAAALITESGVTLD